MLLKQICILASVACTVAATVVPCRAEQKATSVMHYLGERALATAPEAIDLPEREAMKAAVLYQKQDDGLVIEEVAYLWAERAYVFANVIHGQPAVGRGPAIVVIPDRLGHHSQIVYRDFIRRMAKQGCLVLFVGDPYVGKRQAPEAGLFAAAAAAGTPVTGIRVFDAIRALDYLMTRADVDPARIGAVGLGQGADAVRLAGELERRFRFAVPVRERKADDAGAITPEIVSAIEGKLKSLPASNTAMLPCGKPEDPDFSMLRYAQRRIAAQTGPQSAALASAATWEPYREGIIRWLGEACKLKGLQPAPGKVGAQSKQDGLIVETLDLPLDAGWICPARLLHPAESSGPKAAAVVFSHDSRQCIATHEVAAAAARLAERGYWVLLPEHPSPNTKSLRQVEGDDLAGFYALADKAGLPPLALRVAEDLAAFRYLTGRGEVDSSRIVAAGQGIGGVDACLAAVLEPRIAGVVSIDATTFRDWAQTAAPDEQSFWNIMPFLPAMMAHADLDAFYAALAPRPFVLARLKDGWSKSGFQQVAATATAVYRLRGSEGSLVVVSPREPLEERENRAADALQKQVIAVARTILPPPPAPGTIGSAELLKPRITVDSAGGVIWVIDILAGAEQEFIDGGYHLSTWSFFNDNGPAQQGRCVTPLIFKKEGDAYKLTGIGKTRTNSGAGTQSSPFELVAGSDAVGAGHFFGFYTGDPAGKPNAGVVEYDDAPQDRMTVLGMGNEPVVLGRLYRAQASYPRTYSIQAVSVRK